MKNKLCILSVFTIIICLVFGCYGAFFGNTVEEQIKGIGLLAIAIFNKLILDDMDDED